ncbi:S26 family signal peptidase [Allorhizocola rhizosphaerae]|uniref:S26 family signal peptidase n=1 Tax=Allorhizocola rhizosphaerae TaxID=1872709 RepID=UPI000E3E74DD|nr:S26 family signal peptidase [Allorhizocola rhizosphaerae]
MTALLLGVAIAIVATIAVIRARIVVIRVSGISMAPTLRPGDRLLVKRNPAQVPRVGDIVVLPEPGPCRPGTRAGGRELFGTRAGGRDLFGTRVGNRALFGTRAGNRALIVKRVAAAPGDPLPAWLPPWERGQADVVPPGNLVLLGDNLPMSRDSRHFGPVRLDRLIGVVVRRLGEGSEAARL